MKYCPDCDMEFYDEVENCTDCGRPLIDSEKYFAAKAQRDKDEKERRKRDAEIRARNAELEAQAAKDAPAAAARPINTGVYVKRADRYADLKSSVQAFRIVGAILAVAAVLSFGKQLGLPFYIPGNIITQIMLVVMAAGAIAISVKTNQDAEVVKGQIAEEEETTAKLIQWFIDNFEPKRIDATVHRVMGNDLEPEMMSMQRMRFIHDMFIVNHDLKDESYVDMLAEEVYGRLYND